QASLRPLLTSLSPRDHLSLITFDTLSTLLYRDAVGSSPTAALRRLPATATGDNTDIGAAIDEGLNELERPQANKIGTIILLTDGRHAPPSNSPYPSDRGPAWDDLARRAQAVSSRHGVNAFALALRPSTDASLLKTVFSQAKIVNLPPDQITSYFSDLKDRVAELKARALLATDSPTISVDWSDDNRSDDKKTITLHSHAKHMPLVISALNLTSAGTQLDVGGAGLPDTVTLAPGESRPFEVHIASQSGGFGFGEHTSVHHETVTLTGSISSPWSTVITDNLGLRFQPRLQSASKPMDLTNTTGWSYLTFVVLAAILVAVLAVTRGYWLRRQPRLRGALMVVDHDLPAQEFQLTGRKMRFGKGRLSALGKTLRGTLHAVRRRDFVYKRKEYGVRMKIQGSGKPWNTTLWAGDEYNADGVHVSYRE
ncbi:MAG: vWA domain-containing protein, partial [Sciscionella sp.]